MEKYHAEGESIERIRARDPRRPLSPSLAWFSNPPDPLDPLIEELFFLALDRLAGDRKIGMAVGWIPYTSMLWYASVHGLEGEAARDFCDVLVQLDRAWVARHTKEKDAGTPTDGQTTTRRRR